jgi:hypothetical protein
VLQLNPLTPCVALEVFDFDVVEKFHEKERCLLGRMAENIQGVPHMPSGREC